MLRDYSMTPKTLFTLIYETTYLRKKKNIRLDCFSDVGTFDQNLMNNKF